MSRLVLTAACVLCTLLAAGCTSLLPSSREATASPWESYRDAQLTFDKIIPGRTTEIELKHLQLDPDAHPNIAILNYSDVLQRFVPHASISLADLDHGVRECISARTLCKGLLVSQSRVRKYRNGNFVADVLGFSRETHVIGWKFSGIILIREGLVVYKLTGGTPTISETQEESNPLGPVQSIGGRLIGW